MRNLACNLTNMKMHDHYDSRRNFRISLTLLLQLSVATFVILLIFPVDERFRVFGEIRLVLAVCGGGALGSLLRYTGILLQRKERISYKYTDSQLFQRLVNGIPMAAAVYLLIRGTLLNTGVDYTVFNIYGLTLLSIIIGFFSYESLQKLTGTLQFLFDREQLIENKIEKISNVLGLEALANYQGYFITKLQRFPPQQLYNNEPYPYTRPETDSENPVYYEYLLTCWFQPFEDITEAPSALKSYRIDINNGREAEFVTFSVVPRVNGLRFEPASTNIVVGESRFGGTVTFRVQSQSPTLAECWIEVSQMNRLIAVVSPVSPQQDGPR